MDCRTFRATHLDLIDDTLAARDRAAALSHLDACPACARFDCLVRRSALLVRNLPPIVARPGFDARLRARIAQDRAGATLGSRRMGVSAAAAAVAVALLAGAWGWAARGTRPVLAVPASASVAASVDRLPPLGPDGGGAVRGEFAFPVWRAPIWSAAPAPTVTPVRFATAGPESFVGAR